MRKLPVDVTQAGFQGAKSRPPGTCCEFLLNLVGSAGKRGKGIKDNAARAAQHEKGNEDQRQAQPATVADDNRPIHRDSSLLKEKVNPAT
jgi:hypothetical protein